MAINFPVTLDNFTNPTAADRMNSVTVPHATQHANLNDAVEALEARVGIVNSAVGTSLTARIAALEIAVDALEAGGGGGSGQAQATVGHPNGILSGTVRTFAADLTSDPRAIYMNTNGGTGWQEVISWPA